MPDPFTTGAHAFEIWQWMTTPPSSTNPGLHEHALVFFDGGYQPTLPMLIFAKVQGGMSPEINAMATIVLVVTTAIGLYAEHFTRRSRS